MGAELCVKMVRTTQNGQTTSIFQGGSEPRDFTFDYSFWSHDGCEELENGYMRTIDGKYADQQMVYEALGQQVLDNAWEGYNCCLFAYGQTGAGKSYSMVGYGNNKGIIPISSEELFKRVDSQKNDRKYFEVTVSMLEIYNERVQDLLVEVNRRPQGGLKIRENKVTGVFVENLTHHPVSSYAEIENLMELGNTHRSIGSTQMNATSSRAHTIFTIEFRQIELFDDRKAEKLSVINLVDLAGSEKAGQTGATGDRLKEGCAINKSLVVLGTCIERLAEKSQGKNPNAVVPYRESALTRILSNALGGNSKTVMVCAISPANVNYEESLSTLRYADRAKKIKNHAVINESVQDRIIRELTTENDELKKLIESAGGLERIKELQEQLRANEDFARQQAMTWEQKRSEMADHFEKVEEMHGPHLTNLNEDPQLSGRVKYSLENLPFFVGRKTADRPINMVLSSLSVQPVHCVFEKDESDRITLEPTSEQSSEFLHVNGHKVTEKMVLGHCDRIFIGTSTVFVFKDPESGSPDVDVDYEAAVQEKADFQQQELEHMLPAQPEPVSEPPQVVQPTEVVSQPSVPAAQEEEKAPAVIAPVHETPVKKPTEEYEVAATRKRYVHSTLAKSFPLVNEANLIARDLNNNTKFSVKIVNVLPDDVEREEDLEAENWPKEVKVEVTNQDYGLIWHWDLEKFENRLCMLRELLDDPVLPSPEDDPLWDPPEHTLIGKGYYSLKPLGLLFDNPFDILIIGTTGGDAGYLRVNIVPIDEEGEVLEEGPESAEELVGQLINFRIEIAEAWNLPGTHSNNVYCEYHFPSIGVRRTNVVSGYTEHPKFDYKEPFYGIHIDDYLCNYLQKKKLAVSVYGIGMAMKIEKQPVPKPRPSFESFPASMPSAESEMEARAAKNRSMTVQPESKKKKDKKDCTVF